MKMENNNKIIGLGHFDLIKGLTMITIVVVHSLSCFNTENLWLIDKIKWIGYLFYSGNEFFWIVIGYSFKPVDRKKQLKKSYKLYVVPYLWTVATIIVMFPIIHYLNFHYWPGAFQETLKVAISNVFCFSPVAEGAVNSFFGMPVFEAIVIFFLISSFIAINILNLVEKNCSEKISMVVVFAAFVLGTVLDITIFSIATALRAVLFCYIGYVIKKNAIDKKIIGNKVAISISALLVIICALSVYFLEAIATIVLNGNVVIIYLFGELLYIIQSASLFVISLNIGFFENRVLEPVKTIGAYTLWIMCMHSIELQCIPWYRWTEIMPGHQNLAFILMLVLKTIFIFTGCYLIKKIQVLQCKKKMEKKLEKQINL